MADFSKEDLMMLHFYWQSEDGSQQGPSDVAELKRAWKSKQLHKDCHVYGDDGFDDWMTIADLPILKKLIAPPPPPPRRKKAPAAPPPPPEKDSGCPPRSPGPGRSGGRRPGIDDGADFDDVADATASLGFDDAQRSTVWGLVAGILKLGQDDMAVPLREAQALENRDALSKYAYDHLFDWLVGRVNAALRAADAGVACFIGILDIFGFEIFTLNSFEQLCINFTNEKLQQLFNEHTFKTEAATYEREGVPFPPIDFVDNQPICDLIEKRGGILTLLDDTVKGPGKPEQKDAKFSQNLDQACRANAFFVPANDHRGVRGAVFSEVTKRATLGGAFRKQLSALMETLRSTDPHYIRCVKPNQPKRARLFEGAAVLEQLRCAGVFEATAIRKRATRSA
ncbi:hypothetical protein JL720_17131 [Aureococcus anophagefferens]|nr:hypothetical protein JL720_17131 [Aureococcus anophagefferens]